MVVILRIMVNKVYFFGTPAYVNLVARDVCRPRDGKIATRAFVEGSPTRLCFPERGRSL